MRPSRSNASAGLWRAISTTMARAWRLVCGPGRNPTSEPAMGVAMGERARACCTAAKLLHACAQSSRKSASERWLAPEAAPPPPPGCIVTAWIAMRLKAQTGLRALSPCPTTATS
jgi:hypothetical protein